MERGKERKNIALRGEACKRERCISSTASECFWFFVCLGFFAGMQGAQALCFLCRCSVSLIAPTTDVSSWLFQLHSFFSLKCPPCSAFHSSPLRL